MDCWFRRAPFSSIAIFVATILTPLAPQLVQGQSSSPIRKAPQPPPPPPTADQEQFISYWTAETAWRTELQLRNNQVGQVLTVTPVLRSIDGTETPLSPVVVQPQEAKTLDVTAAIDKSAPQLVGAYGSLVLRYRAPSANSLYAAVMIMGVGRSVAFHIDGTGEDQTEEIGGREGIWWLPNESATDYLVLTNQGQNPLQANLSVSDSGGKTSTRTVTLDPRGVARYSIRQIVSAARLGGSYGGVSVSAVSHAGSLDTLHVVFDPSGGFSAIMKMFDYDPRVQLKERDFARTGKWTLRAPMLALSNPDPSLAFPGGTVLQPQLFLRNVTSKPVEAALGFNWRTASATGRAAGPALHLGPHETRRVDVAALQDGKTMPQTAQWSTVVLNTNSLPGEVVAVAASYDQTLRHGAQTPFSDQLAFHYAGSQWQYDSYHDSIITVGNGSKEPTRAAFTVFYNQGTRKYELEQTLQPDEQMWMDVGKLIRERVLDKNGQALPADLTSGSYEIRDVDNHSIGALFEGKIIYDKTYGHVTYGCQICCSYQRFAMFSNPLVIPVAGTASNGVNGLNSCTQQYENVSGDFDGNWSTANSSVATVDCCGTHTGQGLGSTTSSTFADEQWYISKYSCPVEQRYARGSDNVVAVPVNFHQLSTTDKGNGDLNFTYSWDSSSGNLADLSACSVGEIVTYPGGNPYAWPSPPFPADSSNNPTVSEGVATAGMGVDDNMLYPSSTFIKPYSNKSFTATQYFRYKCTNYNGGNYVNLLGPLSIQRSVQQNSNGSWKFIVTKPTNGQATINPLP